MHYQVYDVSDYVTTHPGQEAILKNVGGDSTQGFTQQPAHRVVKNHISSLLEKFYVGDLSPTDVKHQVDQLSYHGMLKNNCGKNNEMM